MTGTVEMIAAHASGTPRPLDVGALIETACALAEGLEEWVFRLVDA